MAETQNQPSENKEDKKSASSITPEQAEEKVTEAVDSVMSHPGNDSLIEEDGDIFWTIQQVSWGIIKTLAILVFLLLLIWFIWNPSSFKFWERTPRSDFNIELGEKEKGFMEKLFGGDTNADQKEQIAEKAIENGEEANTAPSKTQEDSTAKNKETLDQQESTIQDINDAVDRSYQLEAQRVQLSRGTISESVQWLRRAKNIGEISLTVIRTESPSARAQKVEEIIAEADFLFVDSVRIQSQLVAEREALLAAGQNANESITQIESQISQALSALDPNAVEPLVVQKIQQQYIAAENLSRAKIRDTLLRNVQNFDRLLRQKTLPLLTPATEIRAS